MTQNNKEFTLEQIQGAFEKVKSGADFPQFVQDLKLIGVTNYDNYVSDGRTIYYGANNFTINGTPKYPSITITNNSSADKLTHIAQMRLFKNFQKKYWLKIL